MGRYRTRAVLLRTTSSWRSVTCRTGLSASRRMSTSNSTARRPIIALGWAIVVSGGWKIAGERQVVEADHRYVLPGRTDRLRRSR